MTSDLLIREARPGEQETICEVTLAAYSEYAAQMPAHWDAYRQNILATLEDPTPAEQLVAEQDARIVGAVLLYPARRARSLGEEPPAAVRWPEARLLAVAPPARGRGIGRALMQECARRAHQAGAPALALHTTELMRAALRMYERWGFVRAPELDFQPVPEVTIKGYRLELGHA